jgi:hypothetical protein
VNIRISFNCFSFVEVVQGVHTECKECMTEFVSVPKLGRDNMKLPL